MHMSYLVHREAKHAGAVPAEQQTVQGHQQVIMSTKIMPACTFQGTVHTWNVAPGIS